MRHYSEFAHVLWCSSMMVGLGLREHVAAMPAAPPFVVRGNVEFPFPVLVETRIPLRDTIGKLHAYHNGLDADPPPMHEQPYWIRCRVGSATEMSLAIEADGKPRPLLAQEAVIAAWLHRQEIIPGNGGMLVQLSPNDARRATLIRQMRLIAPLRREIEVVVLVVEPQ